jgi:adenine nucleotide transporter 17
VLCINPAITYGMFERLKRAVVKDGEKMTPFKAFLLGAASKTLATVVRLLLSPSFAVLY